MPLKVNATIMPRKWGMRTNLKAIRRSLSVQTVRINKVPKRVVIIRTQKIKPNSKFSRVIRISQKLKITCMPGLAVPKMPHERRKEINRIPFPIQTNHRVFHLTPDKCIKMSTEANKPMVMLNGPK